MDAKSGEGEERQLGAAPILKADSDIVFPAGSPGDRAVVLMVCPSAKQPGTQWEREAKGRAVWQGKTELGLGQMAGKEQKQRGGK